MKKDRIERMCRAAGLTPELRKAVNGHDVFVADGFSLWPHHKLRHFGLGKDMYPEGCYITLWWVPQGDERVYTGTVLYFEPRHDPQYDIASRKQMRINSALAHAGWHVKALERNRGARH